MEKHLPPHRGMSKKELAIYYGVSRKTLQRWLKKHQNEIGTYEGRKYTPNQLSTIFRLLG